MATSDGTASGIPSITAGTGWRVPSFTNHIFPVAHWRRLSRVTQRGSRIFPQCTFWAVLRGRKSRVNYKREP